MKIANITNNKGNSIPNQFIINDGNFEYFQSYDSIIVKVDRNNPNFGETVYLDCRFWDYSTTTGKYRNLFLNENKRETEKKIKSGEYTLVDLNKYGLNIY